MKMKNVLLLASITLSGINLPYVIQAADLTLPVSYTDNSSTNAASAGTIPSPEVTGRFENPRAKRQRYEIRREDQLEQHEDRAVTLEARKSRTKNERPILRHPSNRIQK